MHIILMNNVLEKNYNSFETSSSNKNKGIEKETRIEKKIHKTLESFFYEKVNNVNKISFNKSKNSIFVINNPEIFKSSVNNSYLIFGETKIENNFGILKLKK
nr:nascent polypeptide-associated complex subunit alpha-like protein 1 [Cryptomonas curvata]